MGKQGGGLDTLFLLEGEGRGVEGRKKKREMIMEVLGRFDEARLLGGGRGAGERETFIICGCGPKESIEGTKWI